MTRTRALSGVAALALLVGLGLGAPPAAAQGRDMRGPEARAQDTRGGRDAMRSAARERVTVEMLYDRLEPEGAFVEIRGLGRAWKPADVEDDWRPYTNGRWIFNQTVGWYFASDEPWAEITYHYGRWYDDPNEGWVWIADTEWAPAWVEWRRTRSHVGWRPLPPRNAPRVARSRERTEVVEQWVFVPAERITEERITTVIVEEEPEIRTIYREARPIGRVERRGGVTVNFGLDPEVLRRESNVTIESRNLPRVEAAPVPREVEQISTETRATTTTTTTGTERTRRPDGENRDTTRSRETAPTEPPAGSATAPDRRPTPSDTARQPGAEPEATGTRTQTDRVRRQELERQRQETTRGQDPSTRPGGDRAAKPDAAKPDEATQEQRRRQRATTDPASREPGASDDRKAQEQRRLQGNRGDQGGDDAASGARRPGQEPSVTRRPGSDRPREATPGGNDRPAAARRGEDGQDPALRRPPAGPAAARGGDETTGAVRKAPAPETRGGPGGGKAAEPSAGGRDGGKQRRLLPGAAEPSD